MSMESWLLKNSIIRESIEKRGNRRFPIYNANINHDQYKHYKSVYNLESVQASGLIKHLNDKMMPKCIVLFGSFQRGEDTEDSDIDLFLECKKEAIDLKKYEKTLKRKIQIHFNDNFRSYPKELKNNIINGIVLKGFLEGY